MTAAKREKEQARELCCLICLDRDTRKLHQDNEVLQLVHICTALPGLRGKKFPEFTVVNFENELHSLTSVKPKKPLG